MPKNSLAVAALLTGVLTLSCGGGPKNVCTDKNVRCDAPLVCDPGDGICKCGGRGGVVCGEDFVCDAIANTCQSKLCSGVTCTAGTSCDVDDGKCKCGGTGGKICAAGDVCQPVTKLCTAAQDCYQIACARYQTCETSTGRCLCGSSACEPGKFCSISGANNAKTCVENLCSGTTCSGSSTCDPADGYCKCNGVICQSGDACACPAGVDGGACEATARTCRPGSSCAGVTCTGGTTCDPTDGSCRCGGPGGPKCSSVQICALGPPAQCQGGAQCTLEDGGTKSCLGGTSCDPEDGKCKCGGRGGNECKAATATEPAEVCVSSSVQQSCKRPCSPISPDCTTGTYCYFDPTAATPAAYCSVATDTKIEEQACVTATSCFIANPPKALHCTSLTLGSTGICHAYCDVSAGNLSCSQVPKAQNCVQITGAPAGYGFCQPQ